MEKKKYIDALTRHAEKNGHAYELALNDFLDYLLNLFDVETFAACNLVGYQEVMAKKLQQDEDFGGLALMWMEDVRQAMERGEWLDAFGEIYEEMYLTRGKASKTGQFFTPKSLSDLMGTIIDPAKNEAPGTKIMGCKVMDCAAGSGRLLLAHYLDVSKVDNSGGRGYQYAAYDSDPIACKMSALNMMIHGMNAQVICEDTLTREAKGDKYFINEVRYPFATPYYSVRKISLNKNK